MITINYPSELFEIIKPGNTVRIIYGKNSLANRRIHVREIVDDFIVVYKIWSKRKKWYLYEVRDMYYFFLLYQDGHLKVVKKT